MHTLFCQSHFLRRTAGPREMLFRRRNPAEFHLKLIRLPDKAIPIRMKFVPYFSIELARVRQSFDVDLVQRWVERSEIPKLSCDRRGSPSQQHRQLFDRWIVRFCFLKRSSAVQIKSQYRFVPSPENSVSGLIRMTRQSKRRLKSFFYYPLSCELFKPCARTLRPIRGVDRRILSGAALCAQSRAAYPQ